MLFSYCAYFDAYYHQDTHLFLENVAGKEDGSQGHQTLLPADIRSVPADHAHFAYGNHSVDPMDQPLNFASRLSHENDPKMKSGYPDSPGPVRANDAVSTASSLHAWTTPVAPGAPYPPAFPLAPQVLISFATSNYILLISLQLYWIV